MLTISRRSWQSYRGPDRRQRFIGPQLTEPTGGMLKPAAVIVAGTLLPALAAFGDGSTFTTTAGLLQMFADLAGVAAGVALLVCWKVSGRALPAWLGVAFIDLGILELAYGRLQLLGGPTGAASNPFGRLIPCVLAALAIGGALRAPEVDARLDPVRAVCVTVPVGVVALGLAATLAHRQPASQSVVVLARSLCGVVWLALASLTLISRHRSSASTGTWVAAYLLTLSLSEGLAAALGGLAAGALIAGTGVLAASALALIGGFRELKSTLRSQERHALGLRSDADRLRGQLEQERADLEDQLHDLRNAVTGIRSADSTLRRYAGRLDERTRAGLADALTMELNRLQALIDPRRVLTTRPLRLDEALAPVLATAAAAGMVVESKVGSAEVLADPEALAQIVQNILTNARLYAAGSPVSVRSEREGDRVSILVSDRGPGIAEELRSTIFDRGVRGVSCDGHRGSGLGLYVARRLSVEMGGHLRLAEAGPPGACFVLDLPAASLPASERPGAALPVAGLTLGQVAVPLVPVPAHGRAARCDRIGEGRPARLG